MRRKAGWVGALLAAVAAVAAVAAAKPGTSSDLVVHEWGTFLSMQGSDGVTLDGMYHEEHALPQFVHARSRDQLRLPAAILKGETPVIYFYTNRRQEVRVDVRFPRGIWTQWYPQAQVVAPQLAQTGSFSDLRGGRIVWCSEVIPAAAGSPSPAPPATTSDALWNFAREVDAAYVRTPDRTRPGDPKEDERFLFYRGLGQAPLPLELSAAAGGTLRADSSQPHGLRHLFVLRVEGGRGVYRYLPALAAGQSVSGAIPGMEDARPLAEFATRLGEDLAARLVDAGLYAKEARAMVNTWRASYFRSEGVRVLFVLPQAWTDAFIPLELTPRPRQLVRVMVGRSELLTPEREQRAERAVRDLAAADAAPRERAFTFLRDQGRYVEPVLRRVLRTTRDEQVARLCKQLLLTDWVTELRAAVHSAPTGERVREEPAYVRAQLASLLREIGLTEEAKTEAEVAYQALQRIPMPRLDQEEARHPLRAYARVMEGRGDDAGAVKWYGEFIRFGSQVARREECRGCHAGFGNNGPRDLAWFRDWWAGQRFAAATRRVGTADATIARCEAALRSDPNDAAARMMLGYLYAAAGQNDRAAAIWAGAPARRAAAPR
jgi:hypothetical protein